MNFRNITLFWFLLLFSHTTFADITVDSVVFVSEVSGQPSSSRAPVASGWIGRVVRISKDDRAELEPVYSKFSHIRVNGPTLFRPLNDLSDAVTEFEQFRLGDRIRFHANNLWHGSVKKLFENGMAQVIWNEKYGVKGIRPHTLIRLSEIERLPLADWTDPHIGDQVLFYSPVIAKVGRWYSNHREVQMGRLPFTGLVVEAAGEVIHVNVETETKKGRHVMTLKRNEVFLPVRSFSAQNRSYASGDRAVFESNLGIKPYRFEGKILEIFENGVAAIQWETKNGKKYKGMTPDFLPVRDLTPPNGNEPVPQAGISVMEMGEDQGILGLRSIERALRSPNASYLAGLRELARQRATRACIAKGSGFKGVAAEPKLVPAPVGTAIHEEKDGSFVPVVDPQVRPWQFHISMNKLEPEFRVGVPTVLGAVSFLYVGMFAVPIATLGPFFPVLLVPSALVATWYGYKTRVISAEHATGRLLEGKAVGKRYAPFKEKVATYVISSLRCTDQADQVLYPVPQETGADLSETA